MGVYVKGMYMPPSCYFCPMTNDGLYLCKANNPYRQLEDDCEERRPDWCPLVSVPLHGKLIDADNIGLTNFEIILCQEGNPYKNALEMLLKKIENAPTIIPASEEGEA